MSEIKPIRVMIVDDHAMLRDGLRFFLKGFDDLELVAEAKNGREAIDLCAECGPDVILMDMVMPDLDGAETTQLIRKQFPQVRIIALTSFQEDDLIEKALQAGAIGYLLKNVSAEGLAKAVRQAHAGQFILAPEATEVLIRSTRQRTAKDAYGLTDREQEVLALLVEGFSNAAIAERLVISLATVKFHVRGILTKLGVTSRTEAVALALKQDLVP